ncbi:hypothetical protein SAMN04487785_101238 [Dyella jiangningensis]|nr:hypothetical protein BDW41_103333 [Dyella sp. AtDHG13]SDJ22501.1 hypothetical protein SAMN04487785_101238 [Dyella jiangningensis]
MNSRWKRHIGAVALCGTVIAVGGCATTAADIKDSRTSAQDQRVQKEAQIPVCTHKLGSIAVQEPEAATNW